jgi:hypothetical protein
MLIEALLLEVTATGSAIVESGAGDMHILLGQ